ncbi:MAG: MoxR family ATPase [Desulfoplanes sp.]|nr:MoxR family ATPase [Desulfoplanes sp.]
MHLSSCAPPTSNPTANTMIQDIQHSIESQVLTVNQLRQEIAKVIVGQQDLVDRLLIGLFTKGHVLIEGVPGLAKTTLVKALASTLGQ